MISAELWLQPGVTVEARWPVTGAVLASMVAGLLAILAAGIPTFRQPLTSLLRRVPPRASTLQVGLVEGAVVAAAAAGVVTLLTGDGGPIALLAPGLLAIAGGLLLAQATIPTAGPLARLALRRGRLPWALAGLQIARRPALRRLIAIITVACALLVFAVDAWTVAGRNRDRPGRGRGRRTGRARRRRHQPEGAARRPARHRPDGAVRDTGRHRVVGHRGRPAHHGRRAGGVRPHRPLGRRRRRPEAGRPGPAHAAAGRPGPAHRRPGRGAGEGHGPRHPEDRARLRCPTSAPIRLVLGVETPDGLVHPVSLGRTRSGLATYRAAVPCSEGCLLRTVTLARTFGDFVDANVQVDVHDLCGRHGNRPHAG